MANVIAAKRHAIHRETASFQPIPDEIIFDILLNLPVRSLLRFKSVSKSWYDLISSSSFVDHHTKVSATDPYLSRHAIIFKTDANLDILMCCPLPPVLSNHPTDAVHLNCCLDSVDWGVESLAYTVVGSCNGLVCAVVHKYDEEDDRVLLLNPATRKYNELPKPNAYSCDSEELAHYAFGFDNCSGDYKVIAFVGVTSVERVGQWDFVVEVYSWRTGCWKRIQDFPNGFPLDWRSTFVNGRLYMYGMHFSGRIMLVSLDLATEMFTELPLPPDSAGADFRTIMDLGALGERLCVFRICDRSHAEFWVMNEDDVNGCWTKLVPVPLLRNPGWIGSLVPFFVASTGKILMEYANSTLELYDLKKNSFTRPEIRNFHDIWSPKIYVESLVSPHGDSRTEMPQ